MSERRRVSDAEFPLPAHKKEDPLFYLNRSRGNRRIFQKGKQSYILKPSTLQRVCFFILSRKDSADNIPEYVCAKRLPEIPAYTELPSD